MKKLIVIALVIIVGCNIQKRDIKKLDGLSLQYPSESARLANVLYPCFTGKVKSDTIVQKSVDTVTNTVTVTKLVEGQKGAPDTLIVTRPPKFVYTTITKSVHDTVKDDRQLAYLHLQLGIKSDSLISVKEALKLKTAESTSKNKYLYILIGLGVLLLIYIIIKVYSFFSGGTVVGIAKKLI